MVEFHMSVDFSGFYRELDELERRGDTAVSATLDEFQYELIAVAQRDVPVKTGRLQGSIGVLRRDKESVTVGSTLPYARPVDTGTSKIPARPYLENNGRIVADTIPDKLNKHLR